MSKQHSQLISLIRQSYGTPNPNEAASFLSSAIGRALNLDKETRRDVISEALKGVNLNRGGEAPKAAAPKTKTVYKDTPATLRRLAEYEYQIEAIRRELEALKANQADPKEVSRLKSRIEALTKAQAATERAHLEELALVRATAQADSGETIRLRQQVEELNDRINRLKFALSEMASGNDGETALRQETERRLEAALSELAEAQNAIRKGDSAIEGLQEDWETSQRLLERADADNETLKAERDALQFRMNQQETRHNDDIREERLKRQAASRRADDAERLTTQTKAKLKFEEYNCDQQKKEIARLNARIDMLTGDVSMHEENARHLYHEGETLTARLALANKELEELRKAKKYIFGAFHRASSYTALALGGLCIAAGATSDGINGALDSLAAAAFTVVISYGVTRYLVKDM